MSGLTWTPNGYGGHSLATAGGFAFVQDHWTCAEAEVRLNGRQQRHTADTLAEAKAWCEQQVSVLEIAA